jgi:hypothetical protein
MWCEEAGRAAIGGRDFLRVIFHIAGFNIELAILQVRRRDSNEADLSKSEKG